MTAKVPPPTLDLSLDIRVTPRVIVEAFFDGALLAVWWRSIRSVTTPRALGPYAVEWASEARDDTLGRLGASCVER